MTRQLEIERKARIRDPGALEATLGEMGTLEATTDKEDRYYLIGKHPANPVDFAEDPIFRVRISGGEAVLGYKSRTFQDSTEINQETEIPMGDPRPVIHWLEGYLGLTPFVTKHKRTRLYRLPPPLDRASVELNEVRHLGHFLEVEVICDEAHTQEALGIIDEVYRTLRIPPEAQEPRYYIDLLLEL